MPEYLPFVIFFGAIPLIWGIGTYNRLVKFRNMIEESWSSIDAALKRRANLIPNLINAVKGYSKHETEVLESVTDQRRESNNPQARKEEESAISKSLSGLLAVAEAYPDLKANDNFLNLQAALNEVEREILQARQNYNARVRQLNTAVEQFPSNLLARFFNFQRDNYFSLELATQRELPNVDFR